MCDLFTVTFDLVLPKSEKMIDFNLFKYLVIIRHPDKEESKILGLIHKLSQK